MLLITVIVAALALGSRVSALAHPSPEQALARPVPGRAQPSPAPPEDLIHPGTPALVVEGSRHPNKSRFRPLPSLREQDALERRWIKSSEDFVPKLLEKYNVDAWIMSQLEYAEDTVFRALNPATTVFSARRRTLYLFHTSSILPSPIKWIDNTPELWEVLNKTLTTLDPHKIAVNIYEGIAFSDGLHAGEAQALRKGLGEHWWGRVVSEHMLGIETVSRRSGGEEQLRYYRSMQETIWAMISETFSNRTITPGVTTTTDLEWHFRAQMQNLNVTTWFQPSVSLFRSSTAEDPDWPGEHDNSGVIEEGDMLHVDVGIHALGMATDTQHLAYVLRANETKVPQGLADGLKKANRLQDLTLSHLSTNKTGNEVLEEVRAQMANEGLEGKIYSHPIGTYGHSAGSLVGMTNLQDGVPVNGDLPILDHSWYSIELSASSFVPEWNKTLSFFQEEDAFWSAEKDGWNWVWGRQERFHLVHPKTVVEAAAPALVLQGNQARQGWRTRWT